MKTKPEVTDQEIRSFMNFDKLLIENKVIQLKRRNTSRLVRGALAFVLMASLGTTFYWYTQNHPEAIIWSKEETIIPFVQPKTKQEENKTEIIEETTEAKVTVKNEIKSKRPQQKAPEEKKLVLQDSAVAKTSAYEEAEPVAGFPHLYEYFNTELMYPKEAVKDSIQGITTVSFVINKEGKPEEVKVLHSLGTLFDQEAYRLIEKMPAWKPATMNGKPIRARISLPLTFRMEKGK